MARNESVENDGFLLQNSEHTKSKKNPQGIGPYIIRHSGFWVVFFFWQLNASLSGIKNFVKKYVPFLKLRVRT